MKKKSQIKSTNNLFDELIGFVEYFEEEGAWSTDEAKEWSDRCTSWIRAQIKLNETSLKRLKGK